MRRLAGGLALAVALAPHVGRAISLDELALERDWRVRRIEIRGNEALRASAVREVMVTKPRRWFAIWRSPPRFDPIAFRTDLERVARLYRRRGYYHAALDHDVEVSGDDDAVTAVVRVVEGPPVRVLDVGVTATGADLPQAIVDALPLRADRIFDEDDYVEGAARLRAHFRERGYARVDVRRRARVDTGRNTASVTYWVAAGPPCAFGPVEIVGNRGVTEDVIRRELAFETGQPFRQSRIDQSRAALLALRLFAAVQFEEDTGGNPSVRVTVRVTESPPREVRFGVGYDTEEQVRGLASWRHYDILGGARQLGFSGRASFISREIAADFLQPHFPGHGNRSRLLFLQSQEDEDSYLLNRTRLSPRLEWQAAPTVTGFVFHRLEWDGLSEVPNALEARLPAAVDDGILSGLGLGVDWNGTNDLLDPTRGLATSFAVEPVGGFLGGDFEFVRLTAQGRVYQPLVGRLVGAGRLLVGAADPVGGGREVPLFERFYSGGNNSVRGYGRRRLGPLAGDEPLGGRTLVETSVELRHPITETIGATVFVDAGQVALRSWDFPFDDLQLGVGLGARYRSPVGAIRLDVGFPLDRPAGDGPWQVHVSLGAAF